jgi:hypothetical protein
VTTTQSQIAIHIDPACHICGGVSVPSVLRRFKSVRFMLCEGCHKVAKRRFNPRRGRKKDRIVQVATKAEWVQSLRAAWDVKEYCLRCGISGVRLVPNDPSSPLYPTLDHSDPGTGKGGWMVVAAAINDIKSDLDMEELRRVLPLLSALVTGNGSDGDRQHLESALKRLRHWKRVRSGCSEADRAAQRRRGER